MRSKKGAELSINTVIIIILALVALVVILFIFSSSMREFASSIIGKLKNALGLFSSSQGNLQ